MFRDYSLERGGYGQGREITAGQIIRRLSRFRSRRLHMLCWEGGKNPAFEPTKMSSDDPFAGYSVYSPSQLALLFPLPLLFSCLASDVFAREAPLSSLSPPSLSYPGAFCCASLAASEEEEEEGTRVCVSSYFRPLPRRVRGEEGLCGGRFGGGEGG